jgi:ferritin-like metal-binding protein YciE
LVGTDRFAISLKIQTPPDNRKLCAIPDTAQIDEKDFAMQISKFKEMYLAELQEMANAEDQMAEVMSRLSEAASHHALKSVLLRHAKQALAQKQRIASILQKHGAKPGAHTDQAMQALVQETQKMFTMLKGNELRDAGLVASAQKLGHYEIAAYGTAAALAGQLDMRDDQKMLHQSLEEEKKNDALLTQLAKREVNRAAIAA